MHLHVRPAPRYPTEGVAGVTGMSGCWSAIGEPIAQGDDVFTVLPGTLPEYELERRLADADAAVVMKIGRHLAKVRRALDRAGRLERAIYVERGTMTNAAVMPLVDKLDTYAPYFAIVLVPGWEARPAAASSHSSGSGPAMTATSRARRSMRSLKLKRSTATGLISTAFRCGKANRGMLPTIARKRHAPAPRPNTARAAP